MSDLARLPVLILDGQATGATPQHGHLVELGWAVTTAGSPPRELEIHQRLIRPPTTAGLSPRFGALTGLTHSDFERAPTPASVWADIRAAAQRAGGHATSAPTVIHCARFEGRFLVPIHRHAAPRAHYPLRPICTLELSRRVVPDIPRRGLRALAGYFGHDTGPLRRAHAHVMATAVVWHHLVDRLTAVGIRDLNELEAFLRRPPYRPKRRTYPMPRALRLRLPDGPGVYRLLRSSGDVLYVGKATSLRSRVNSYFQKQGHLSERMLELLSQARDVDVTPTPTTLDAALLESDEIKRLRPPYNVALRAEDRHPWFASARLEDLAPRATKTHTIGPLGSAWWIVRQRALWQALDAAAPLGGANDPLITALGPKARGADPRVLREGLNLFRERLPLRAGDLSQVVAVGSIGWDPRSRNPPSLDEVPPTTDLPTTDWTPGTVVEALNDVIVAVAHALRRARWLQALSESSIAWTDDGRWHGLTIIGGAVADRFDPHPRHPLPSPAENNRSPRSRAACFDIATFDRLRVLTTELRSIANAGDAQVRLGPDRTLSSDRLRRALSWV